MNDGTPATQPEQPPGLFERAWNLAKSLAGYVADGCQSASPEQYAERLKICDTCPQRSENICRMCGCYLPVKATMRAVQCPLGLWPSE
jgi:hypothetical protein